MKDQIIIVGLTSFSELVFRTIREEDAANVVAFAVHKKYLSIDNFMSIPVVAIEDLQDIYSANEVKVLNTIGYNTMNDYRQQVSDYFEAEGYCLYSFVSKKSYVADSVTMGKGCIILPGSNIGHNVTLGNGIIIYHGVCLTHNIVIEDYVFLCSGLCVGGFVRVGNHSFLGLNSTISTGIKVAPYTLVGAGAFINNDTIEGAVYSVQATKLRDNLTSKDLIKKITSVY